MTKTQRKHRLHYCPECRGQTCHELVSRYYRPSAGRLPGPEWNASARKPVLRCLLCKHEGKPPGLSCETCGAPDPPVKFTRKKFPGMNSQVRECKLCGTEMRTVVKKARG